MKKYISLIVMAALVLVPALVANSVSAATPNWNVTGNYDIAFNFEGNDYVHDLSLTQNGSGEITGTGGGYPANSAHTYEWVIDSGTVSSDEITFEAHYVSGADAVTPLTVMNVSGNVANDGSMSGTWSDNYQGGSRSGTFETTAGSAVEFLGTLNAEDFGVVDYDTGLGQLRGYTAGFGLDDATFADASSVVVKLYAEDNQLLQTNTLKNPELNPVPGNQISSPFDVSGDFDYTADGYWINVHEAQYGQSVPAVKVVATVILENGKILVAENTNLTGDPTDIYPEDTTAPDVPTHVSPANGATLTSAVLTEIDWSTVTDPSSPVSYYYESSLSSATEEDGSFTSPAYESGALSDSKISTPGTPEGTYYWHVRAVDSEENSSAWSNAWSINVDNDPPPPPTGPESKDSCKNGGWKNFTNPSFKNQGQCVSYTNKH